MEWIRAHEALQTFTGTFASDSLRGNDFQGYECGNWEDETWVLHPIFELIDATDTRTYDVAHRAEALDSIPDDEVGQRMRSILERPGTILTGTRSGLLADPGAQWRRVRWAEYLARSGRDLHQQVGFPAHNWFAESSWSVSVLSPCEGSMDIPTLNAVHRTLFRRSRKTKVGQCLFLFAGAHCPDADARVARGGLDELSDAIEELRSLTGRAYAPNNMWSAELEWFTYTDIDLMATKICGSRSLVNAIRRHPYLETCELLALPGDAES